MLNPVVTRCAHVFCKTCIAPALDRKPNCPLCRAACAPGDLIEAPPEEAEEEEEEEEGAAAAAAAAARARAVGGAPAVPPSAKARHRP